MYTLSCAKLVTLASQNVEFLACNWLSKLRISMTWLSIIWVATIPLSSENLQGFAAV